VTTVQEIKAALPQLSAQELVEVRDVLDDLLEDQLELSPELEADLEEAKQDIQEGRVRLRKTP
jgi:hypothetical protein